MTIASFALIVCSILYFPAIRFFSRNKTIKKQKVTELPKITIIIPTYNEEKNIAKKLNNTLSLDYPKEKIKIIVADGGSKDKTVDIARKFNVQVIKLKRRGKIVQINAGIRASITRLVGITDADVTLKRDALKKAVSYLNDKVVAVGGCFKIIKINTFYAKGKAEYHKQDWKIRYLESLLHAPCSLDGKFTLFDKTKIKKINPKAYTDDLEMTIQIIRRGYRCVIALDCQGYEPMHCSIWQEINQMRRRIRLSIANAFQHLDMLFNLRYGYYSMFIFPFHRFINMFTPFFLFIISLFLILYYPMILILLLSLALLSILISPKLRYYSILVTATILAWLDIITGNIKRGCKWDY